MLDQDISEFLQKALEIDGENEDILRVKAGVLAKNGEYDEAKDIMGVKRFVI